MRPPTPLHLPLRSLALAACLALFSSAHAQDRIVLKPVANVTANVVRVADIADVQGPPALGDVIVVKDLRAEVAPANSPLTIDLPRVRAALEKSPAINWGRLTLSGVPCKVRPAPSLLSDEPCADANAPDHATNDAPTIRDQVASWLARSFACQAADLRLSFDDAQRDILNASTQGLTVSIRSLGASDKLSLAVTTYRGDLIANTATLRVTPLIRRDVATAARRISRGEAITADALSHDEQWLPPSVAPIQSSDIQGVIARVRIDPGTIIRPEHIDQPLVIKKGEIITVDCLSGGVVVRAMARAMTPGKDGDIIPFQYLESKRPFNARVNGPGRAVLVAATESQFADDSDQTTSRLPASQPKAPTKPVAKPPLPRAHGTQP